MKASPIRSFLGEAFSDIALSVREATLDGLWEQLCLLPFVTKGISCAWIQCKT